MTQQDPRFQTFVAAFVPLQKLLNNNAISESSYKAICAILEQELDNRPLQSEQDVISTIQTRAQAQIPPAPPQGMQGSDNSPQTNSRGLSDEGKSGILSRGYVLIWNLECANLEPKRTYMHWQASFVSSMLHAFTIPHCTCLKAVVTHLFS